MISTRYFKPLVLLVTGGLICATLLYSYSSKKQSENWSYDWEGGEKDAYIPEILKQYDKKFLPEASKAAGVIDAQVTYKSEDSISNDVSILASKIDEKVSIKQKRMKKVTYTTRGWSYKGSNYLRCKVQTIGCYQPPYKITSKKGIIAFTSSQMTDSLCIEKCSKKARIKFMFAGLRNGNECICDSSINDLIETEDSDYCNVPCAGDSSRTCGGRDNLTMVYHLKSECIEQPSLEEIVDETSVIGCYQKPRDLSGIMEQYKVNRDWGTARCLLKCEQAGLVLAILVHPDTCFCGLTTKKFNLSDPQDISLCTTNYRNYVHVYRTNSEDRRCGRKRFLRPGELKRKIALISFPGSGNTWLRHIIESVTGIYTGSFFNDTSLQNGGYLGEMLKPDSYKVAVVKTHNAMHFIKNDYISAFINIIRNPYDAILSEFNRRHKGHTGTVTLTNFNLEEFEKIGAGAFARKWRETTKSVIDSGSPSFFFYYEDLVKDTNYYAENLARFILGHSVNERDLEDRLLCLLLSGQGNFKRKKKNLGFDPYSDRAKTNINLAIKKLDSDLREAGLNPLPNYSRPIDER